MHFQPATGNRSFGTKCSSNLDITHSTNSLKVICRDAQMPMRSLFKGLVTLEPRYRAAPRGEMSSLQPGSSGVIPGAQPELEPTETNQQRYTGPAPPTHYLSIQL